MPRNGSGVHSWPVGTAAVSGTDIESAPYNAMLADASAEITASINAAGTKPFAADQPMATYKLTGLGAGGARTDSVQLGQVQDGKLNWAVAGGTADALTLTLSPAITALVDGQEVNFRASNANATTTPTLSVNGLTARTITKLGGAALVAGDIAGAGAECTVRYNLANTRWELVDPRLPNVATKAEVLEANSGSRMVAPFFLGALWQAGGTITDTATPTIGDGGYFQLNGGTTITAIVFTVDTAGRTVRVRINADRTITHNATSLILPGGIDIQAKAGDLFEFRSLGSGNVILDRYTLASGKALVGSLTLDTAKASTSGTSVDFTGIPAWARRVIIAFNDVSTTGTSPIIVQIGDSGGFETSGYASSYNTFNSSPSLQTATAGFGLAIPTAAGVMAGTVTLSNISGNIWISSHSVGLTASVSFGSGSKTLSDVLDRVRITTAGGSETFDAGSINIMYE